MVAQLEWSGHKGGASRGDPSRQSQGSRAQAAVLEVALPVKAKEEEAIDSYQLQGQEGQRGAGRAVVSRSRKPSKSYCALQGVGPSRHPVLSFF